jgi:hypothetical protein
MDKNKDDFTTTTAESIRLLLQLDYDTTAHELEQKYT